MRKSSSDRAGTEAGSGAPGIRRYLLAFLSVFTAIPVLLFGNSQAGHQAESDRRAHDQALVTVAQSVARQLDTMLDSRRRDLEVLAGAIEVLGEIRGPRVQRLLEEHRLRSHYYTGSYVADAEGNPLERSPAVNDEGERGLPSSYRDRDYYQELLRTHRTAVSKVQEGRFLHAINVQIATPIFGANRAFIGYVEGSIELDTFAALVRSAAAQVPGSRIVVLDAASRVVADSAPAVRPGTDYLATAPVFGPEPAGRRLTSALDEHGAMMRAAVEPGGSIVARWRVVAAEAQQRIDENAKVARNHTWAAAALVWALVLLGAAIVATRFGRRLSELADTVSAIGSGDFARRARPPERWEPREIAVLITQVARMAESQLEHTRELETLVSARTAALAEVNAELRFLVDALERADDGIEITGPDARFIYVNPAFERITGYRASELIGKTPAILRSSAHVPEAYEAIWERVNSGQVWSGALIARKKDGSFFDQELTVWPILNEAGTITHFVGLRRDVTERRRTEQALRVSERMASVGTLAAGIAHEINNPLTYVLLNLNYLREQVMQASLGAGANAPRMQVAVDRALEGAERVSAIVKDLRTLSRPSDRTTKRVDPRAVLESALRMVGSDIRHRARLVERYRAIPPVMANEAELGQVFLNLLVNAVQALAQTPPGQAEISVATGSDEQGRAVVEIADTGCGIPAENLARIFDPFFTTKPVGLGTGIGLSICHGSIKAMHGEIHVESTVGQGSVFRVVLPAAAAGDLAAAGDSSTDSVRRTRSPERVLVIDDDWAVGEALRQALSHHEVTVVDSAKAGLAALERGSFTAILCDMMMPVASGTDFYERLAERDPAQLSLVVFITGGVLTDAAREFVAQRQIPCLEKPVSVDQLEAVLARLAEARGRAPSSRGDGGRPGAREAG